MVADRATFRGPRALSLLLRGTRRYVSMVVMTLAPCQACARHIRAGERICPFCGAGTSAAFRARPARVVPATKHLSRAVLFALGAAGLGGCSHSVYGGPPVPGDTGDAGHVADPGVTADLIKPDTGTSDAPR
jgi:hypothetical protein